MKTFVLLLSSLIFVMNQSDAQSVTEDVNFNFYQSISNNDFVNHFSGGLGLNQDTLHGITAGCLATPDSINWGNDNAIYCSRYKPIAGDTTNTSICFKYDSTTVNLNSFQRTTAVFLVPSADFNHYLIATVEGNKKIALISYGWVNSPYPSLTLLHNHWYRYQVKTLFKASTNQVYVKAEVFDLGLTGTSNAVSVNSSAGTFTDNILANDTSIQVSVMGARYGGGVYLDNFHFHGGKGVSNCINITGLGDLSDLKNISIYPNPAQNVLNINFNRTSGDEKNVCIYNLEGRKILKQKIRESSSELNISSLENGIYFVKCETKFDSEIFKIIINR